MSGGIYPALVTASGAIIAAISVQLILIFRERHRKREVLYGELLDLLRHVAANDSALDRISEVADTAAQYHFQMLELPKDNLSISTPQSRFLRADQTSELHRLAVSARNYNFVVQNLVADRQNRTPEVLASLRMRGRNIFEKGMKVAGVVFPCRAAQQCLQLSQVEPWKCRAHRGAGEFRLPPILSGAMQESPIADCPLALAIWQSGHMGVRRIEEIRPSRLRSFAQMIDWLR